MKTISDLIERFQLYALCTDCDRMERVALEPMIEVFGPDLTIDSMRHRLRCRQCRRRTGDIRIVYVGERAKLSGFHYRGNSPRGRSSPPEAATDQPDQRGRGGTLICSRQDPGQESVRSSVDSSVSPKPSTPT